MSCLVEEGAGAGSGSDEGSAGFGDSTVEEGLGGLGDGLGERVAVNVGTTAAWLTRTELEEGGGGGGGGGAAEVLEGSAGSTVVLGWGRGVGRRKTVGLSPSVTVTVTHSMTVSVLK